MPIQSVTTAQSENLIREFLNNHHSGTLATADSMANPQASVVYFSLDDDFSLLFATKTETQKYKNIMENKQVAFTVYEESSQTMVQVMGRAELVNDNETRQNIINNMFTNSADVSHREFPPAEKLIAGDYAAIRIIPMVIKMAVYARPDNDGDGLYETLLFSE